MWAFRLLPLPLLVVDVGAIDGVPDANAAVDDDVDVDVDDDIDDNADAMLIAGAVHSGIGGNDAVTVVAVAVDDICLRKLCCCCCLSIFACCICSLDIFVTPLLVHGVVIVIAFLLLLQFFILLYASLVITWAFNEPT